MDREAFGTGRPLGAVRQALNYLDQLSVKHFLVVGRIPGEDEDTGLVFEAESLEKAIVAFEEEMYRKSEETKEEVAAQYEGTHIVVLKAHELNADTVLTVDSDDGAPVCDDCGEEMEPMGKTDLVEGVRYELWYCTNEDCSSCGEERAVVESDDQD